jgi:hypothetical protein
MSNQPALWTPCSLSLTLLSRHVSTSTVSLSGLYTYDTS